MGHEWFSKKVFYFLGIFSLLLLGGLSTYEAGAEERSLPIGEMVSRGEVTFEAREKVWRNVEPSYFPVFPGLKIKTEKGAALISLANNSQVELSPSSVISWEQKDRLRLYRGRIEFRIASREDIRFRVGHLTVARPLSLQASRKPSVVAQENETAIGSLFVHPNGSVTIRSIQGQFMVLNQKQTVLAGIPPGKSLTIPSTIVEKPPAEKTPKEIFAQVGEIDAGTAAQDLEDAEGGEESGFMGLSGWTWGGVGIGVLAIGGVAAAGGGGGGGGGGGVPVCP